MLLHQTQRIIASDTHRFRVCNIGRRWGKTTEAVEEAKGKLVYKESRVAYIACTYQQARDIAWEMFKKELKNITTSCNESRLEIRVKNLKGTESVLILRGWESVETLRGQAFDFIILDEVAMMRNFWIGWNEVLAPTLTDRKGEAMFLSTPKGFNHFYDLFNLQDKDKDFRSFHFTSYDNPHLPVEELERQKQSITEDAFAQEFLADFRKQTGLVFKEFNRKFHIFDEAPTRINETILGVDFGFTNPCAIITVKIDYDNNYWITDEYYKTGKTEAQIAEYISSLRANKVYPDPESPSAIQELIGRGVNVLEVIKNKDSIKSGINRMRNLFLNNRLKIHKSCINLINELESYSYPEKKDDKNEEENPIKENDHAIDATRYAISMFELGGNANKQAIDSIFERNLSRQHLNEAQ